MDIFETIEKEELSTQKKVDQLKIELTAHHNDERFLKFISIDKTLKLH
jgi:hypothetical protein